MLKVCVGSKVNERIRYYILPPITVVGKVWHFEVRLTNFDHTECSWVITTNSVNVLIFVQHHAALDRSSSVVTISRHAISFSLKTTDRSFQIARQSISWIVPFISLTASQSHHPAHVRSQISSSSPLSPVHHPFCCLIYFRLITQLFHKSLSPYCPYNLPIVDDRSDGIHEHTAYSSAFCFIFFLQYFIFFVYVQYIKLATYNELMKFISALKSRQIYRA